MFGKKCSDKRAVRTSADMLDLDDDALQSKSNMEILSEIEGMMFPPSGEEIDTDKVEQYLALLQKRAPVMEGYDSAEQWNKLVDAHPFLIEESSTMPKLRNNSDSKRVGLSINKSSIGLRIFRIAEIALASMFFLVVTANAFGVNPIQALLSWGEGIVQVYCNPSGVMELPENDPSEYHSLEEALIANGIDAKDCPTWVPQDYSLYLVRVQEADGIIKCTASYESTRGELIIRVVKRTIYDTVSTEEREDSGYIYSHNGIEYYLVSNYDWSKAGWDIGLNSYVISGQVSEDELKEIINSIA